MSEQPLRDPVDDLPAAHSMDTDWFAVDGHGHVALFDSGEGGAVPVAHFGAWNGGYTYWGGLLEELLIAAPAAGLPFDAEGLFEAGGGSDHRPPVTEPRQLDRDRRYAGAFVLELAGPASACDPGGLGLVRGWLDAAYPLGDPTQRLVYVPQLVPADLAALWSELGVRRALVDVELGPERFGLYAYDNQRYDAGPYARRASPRTAPLRIEALGTGLRRRLAELRLATADFERDREIQPFEHLPSNAWGATWVATDGTVHPAAPDEPEHE